MKNTICLIPIVLGLYACSTPEVPTRAPVIDKSFTGGLRLKPPRPQSITLPSANTNSGKKILDMGKMMANSSSQKVAGSSWSYINEVYNQAGFPKGQRVAIHKGDKNVGPYTAQLLPGDWIYYKYRDIDRSGIFIRWIDETNHIAEVLGYSGQRGVYQNHRLAQVYQVIRTIR